MQVGDLVTYMFQRTRWRRSLSVDVGLVVETGKYTGNTDVKVLWMGSGAPAPYPITQKSTHLRVINESR